jgi:hypothetical protein
MEDVTRKRILRMLDQLPDEQLYQVLDYIEFLEVKYARDTGRKPDAFQQFAERLEDQMRVRSLAPKAMKGTMKMMSTAGKVLDGVRELGKDLVTPPDRTGTSVRTANGDATTPGSGTTAPDRSGNGDEGEGETSSAEASSRKPDPDGQSGE